MDTLGAWLDQTKSLLETLNHLLDRKQTAIWTMDAKELNRLTEEEAQLVDRLHYLTSKRRQILASVTHSGSTVTTLLGLLEKAPTRVRDAYRERLTTIRRLSAQARRKASGQWLDMRRVGRRVAELLAILKPGLQANSVGQLLDRSA